MAQKENQQDEINRRVQAFQKDKKVVSEDYFRVLKENKQIEKGLKSKKDLENSDKKQTIGDREDLEEEVDQDEEELIKEIDLPQETLYYIDKVVRQRSKMGPIGVDNSELINIEMEKEIKQKNQYVDQLYKGNNPGVDGEEEDEEDEGQLMERLAQK